MDHDNIAYKEFICKNEYVCTSIDIQINDWKKENPGVEILDVNYTSTPLQKKYYDRKCEESRPNNKIHVVRTALISYKKG